MRARRPTYLSLAYSHAPTDPRVRRHCEAMVSSGWNVVQLGIATADERAVGRLGDILLLRWRRPRYRGAALWRYAWSYIRFAFWARAMTRRLSRKRPVRVVQVNNVPTYLIWAAKPARVRGARVILDIHDPEPELFLSKFASRPGARMGASVLTWGERQCARQADVVLCVHEHHRRLTERHGVPGEKLRVVINQADERLFPLLAPRLPTPFLGYHGTVSRRMGLDVVLEAIALLRAQGVEVRAAVYGDGDDVRRLWGMRDQLGLLGLVDIPGRRFRLEDLLPRIREFGIGVVALRRDPLTDVMLPTKLIEYARLGVPAVACWTPTVADYFPQESVEYVREFTAASVAAAVRNVLKDPEKTQRRAQEAQQLPIARSWQESGMGAYVSLVDALGRTAFA